MIYLFLKYFFTIRFFFIKATYQFGVLVVVRMPQSENPYLMACYGLTSNSER